MELAILIRVRLSVLVWKLSVMGNVKKNVFARKFWNQFVELMGLLILIPVRLGVLG